MGIKCILILPRNLSSKVLHQKPLIHVCVPTSTCCPPPPHFSSPGFLCRWCAYVCACFWMCGGVHVRRCACTCAHACGSLRLLSRMVPSRSSSLLRQVLSVSQSSVRRRSCEPACCRDLLISDSQAVITGALPHPSCTSLSFWGSGL